MITLEFGAEREARLRGPRYARARAHRHAKLAGGKSPVALQGLRCTTCRTAALARNILDARNR